MGLSEKLYRKLYLIRKTEKVIQKYYNDNDMKTPMHMSIGEEAIVAGICGALSKKDQVFGTHRSHALYIAKTEETDMFFAELYGKENGIAQGKCGSMHLFNYEFGFMGGSAIVGGNFAMAVGSAFANKFNKNDKIVIVFFGDGAIEEGSFWESFNLACLWKLPIIFVCEDNRLAVYTSKKNRQGYNNIVDIINQFKCKTFESDTTDVRDIYAITKGAMEIVKQDICPCFIHLEYYRYLDHVGINEDFYLEYRSKDELNKWLSKDPIFQFREKLLNKIGYDMVIEIEKNIELQIEDSIKKAQQSSFCRKQELYKGVFYEE